MLDSNPDSDSKQLDSDSDSRKIGWIRIQLDLDLRCLDSDPDSDLRCLELHITGLYNRNTAGPWFLCCTKIISGKFWRPLEVSGWRLYPHGATQCHYHNLH